MTIEFKLPEVSEGVEAVDIAALRVSVGDVIEAGSVVCEVETDKAVADVECPHSGTVTEIRVSEGDSIPIGTTLIVIDAGEAPSATEPKVPEPSVETEPAAAEPSAAPAPATVSVSSGPVDVPLPEVSEGVTAVDVADVHVSVGDSVVSGAVICEVETDKAVAEIESPHDGTVTAVHVAQGDNVTIGTALITLDATSASAPPTATTPAPAAPTPAPATNQAPSGQNPQAVTTAAPKSPRSATPVNTAQPPPPAGPATRRLARKLGVDLFQVTGTARGGRIVIEDIEAFVRDKLSGSSGSGVSLATGIAPAVSLPDFSQFGPVEREPLNKIYRSAASNLHESWLTIPHVTQHDMADVTELETARRRYVQSNANSPKITMTAIMIKAVVGALKAFPHFNSSLDMETGEWVIKRYYHIGVAVDTPKGLVVPVIRDCDQKNVLQVAAELTDLAERARDRKLKSSEMRGASFTITNLGGIGGTYFTPIVNHPEVAILGLSRGQKHLKLEDGELVERTMLPLSLSYDHRAINGADAARFIVKLSGSLTNLFELF